MYKRKQLCLPMDTMLYIKKIEKACSTGNFEEKDKNAVSYTHLFKINRWERFARAVCQRFNVFQNDFLKLLRESAVRLSHHTLEVGDDRIRIRKSGTCSQDVFFCQAIFKHKDGQITNSFRSRSNFYDISKQIIGIFV